MNCSSGSGTFTADVLAAGVPSGSATLFLQGTERDPSPHSDDDAGSVYIDNVSIIAGGCGNDVCELQVNTVYSCLCPNCYTNLTHGGACDLQTVETGVADYESSDWIRTTQPTVIQAGAQVDYDAEDEVELTDDFEVKQGAIFHAFIDGCGGAQIQASPIQNK